MVSVDYGNIRMLAVERVAEIEESDDIFKRPERLDPAEPLDKAFNITLGGSCPCKDLDLRFIGQICAAVKILSKTDD